MMWSEAMFADFKKIVEQLLEDGWIFVTPIEYAKQVGHSDAR